MVFNQDKILIIKIKNLQILSCIVIHLVAFCFVLVNLPLDANMNPTDLAPCIVTCIVERPSAKIAVFTAFLLGIGDAGVNNVIYTTISKIWKKESAPAFALMKVKYNFSIKNTKTKR